MKEIKYLAYYAPQDDSQQRASHILAHYYFITYVVEQLNYLGYSVKIISANRTKSKTSFYGRRLDKIRDNFTIQFLPTFPKRNIIAKLLDIIALKLSVFIELLKCKKDDDVIVYHATSYMTEVKLAHRFKKFKWIHYVGEIYGDVNLSRKLKDKEMRCFKEADAFIFATEFLDKIINKKNKPFAVLYGAYRNEPIIAQKTNDGRVHCVYAGTFDSRKGEARQSVLAASYLPDNYVVHICGFGLEEDTNIIKKLIEDAEPGKVIFEGRLFGDDFTNLLQKCDIGLFTPIADAKFNESDFPSKIFTYMTNGLRVVSARVEPVEQSPIGQVMYFYDGNDPKSIASAIQKVKFDDNYDSRAIVTMVEKEFRRQFNELLK